MKRALLLLMASLITAFYCSVPIAVSKEAGLRVISLAPSTTDILYALGLDEEIIAVSNNCDIPTGKVEKARVGVIMRPDIERIVSLKPDIVFCTGLAQSPVVEKLRKLNMKVFVSNPSTISGLYASIKDIGSSVYRQDEADALVKRIEKRMDAVREKTASIPANKRTKVFFEIWYNPLTTVGRGSFINEMIEAAGGVNIASGVKGSYSHFSAEEVIRQAPDCIIVAYMSKETAYDFMLKRTSWKDIPAIRYNRVFNDIDPSILLRPGPRIAEGVEELNKRFYPEKI